MPTPPARGRVLGFGATTGGLPLQDHPLIVQRREETRLEYHTIATPNILSINSFHSEELVN